MTAPKPDAINQTVVAFYAAMGKRLRILIAEYEWAYGASGQRVVRDNAGKITQGATSDPTAGIVGEVIRTPESNIGHQAAVRRVLERVPRKLAEAENAVNAIEKELLSAMDRLDPREGFDPLRYPVSVSNEELERLHAAQRERANRGEGIA